MAAKEKTNNANKTAAIIFLAIIVAAGIIFLHPQISGLFSLTGPAQAWQGEQTAHENEIEKTIGSTPEETASVEANLEFEVIQPTQLTARLVGGKLYPCPQYSGLVFEVTNSGKFAAQRLFVDYPPHIKVQNCVNCGQKEILAGQTATVKLNACRAEEKRSAVEFSAVNAEKKALELK